MEKRCQNCGFFPFCNNDKAINNGQDCDKWVKRERQIKLENTDCYNYDFEEVE